MDFAEAQKQALDSRTCGPPCNSRTKVVFGEGPLNAELFIVGEAPGFNEDKEGKPFQGASGMLLDRLLASAGLDREEVYLTTLVKCRPPEGRSPKPAEINACRPYLLAQLDAVDPKVVVALGNLASRALTGRKESASRIRGRVVPLDGRDEAEVLQLAAALECRSEHPLAHAILSAANGADLPPVAGFRSLAGRGAEGKVGGKGYLIGSPRLFAERGLVLDGATEALEAVERAGETPVILGSEASTSAVFGIADAVRPDARATLESLREAGVGELVMLTGDAEAPARRIAEDLGISYRARLLSEQKVQAVRDLVSEHGDVGMVGDGVNDAPALAASSVGFAMGAAGTDVALETADVALMQDDLPKLAKAVKLSRAAEGIIKQNVAVSILIKGLFVLLAPFGLVALWLAVLADMGTSIAVTLNGLRLFRAKGASRDRL